MSGHAPSRHLGAIAVAPVPLPSSEPRRFTLLPRLGIAPTVHTLVRFELDAALAVAEAAAVPVIITSMFETSVGLAAGLALACALPELSRACGLDTLDALAGDVAVDSLRPDGWVLRSRPVVPDPEILARYSVIR